MVFKKYSYGTHKREIRALMHKRLKIKGELRYYAKQTEGKEVSLKECESQIETLRMIATQEYNYDKILPSQDI